MTPTRFRAAITTMTWRVMQLRCDSVTVTLNSPRARGCDFKLDRAIVFNCTLKITYFAVLIYRCVYNGRIRIIPDGKSCLENFHYKCK